MKYIYSLYSITKILRPYTLKAFSEQLNEIKLDGDGITSIDIFQAKQQALLSKISTHGAVNLMSWI